MPRNARLNIGKENRGGEVGDELRMISFSMFLTSIKERIPCRDVTMDTTHFTTLVDNQSLGVEFWLLKVITINTVMVHVQRTSKLSISAATGG